VLVDELRLMVSEVRRFVRNEVVPAEGLIEDGDEMPELIRRCSELSGDRYSAQSTTHVRISQRRLSP
jgi:hypothetical protein